LGKIGIFVMNIMRATKIKKKLLISEDVLILFIEVFKICKKIYLF